MGLPGGVERVRVEQGVLRGRWVGRGVQGGGVVTGPEAAGRAGVGQQCRADRAGSAQWPARIHRAWSRPAMAATSHGVADTFRLAADHDVAPPDAATDPFVALVLDHIERPDIVLVVGQQPGQGRGEPMRRDGARPVRADVVQRSVPVAGVAADPIPSPRGGHHTGPERGHHGGVGCLPRAGRNSVEKHRRPVEGQLPSRSGFG